MTTICLNEDSVTSASWLHRLRKSTSTGTAASASSSSDDNETSTNRLVVNSKEINSRRFKRATSEIDGKVPDESTDGDADQDSEPAAQLHRLAVSVATEEPRTRRRIVADEEEVRLVHQKTNTVKVWRQMTQPLPKVDLQAELCLTGTIRVKIDRKNRKATLITHNFESIRDSHQHQATSLVNDNQEETKQCPSKSVLIQSASNDICTSPVPKDTRTLPLTASSPELAMAESIVLSQSSPSSHQSASPFGKSFSAYSSPKSTSSHHSSLLDETSNSKHSLSTRMASSPSALIAAASPSTSSPSSTSIGTRSTSVTSNSSASAPRTQPHDNDSNSSSRSTVHSGDNCRMAEVISHTSANDEDDAGRETDNCRPQQNSRCSLVSRPIEDNDQAQVNNNVDLKDKDADSQPKTSVIVSSAAALQSITSKRPETDSASSHIILPPVPPSMNNALPTAAASRATAHRTCESSPVTSASAASTSNRTNDLEQSRSSNCGDEDDGDGDNRTECSDKQSIGDNNETDDHRRDNAGVRMEEDDNDTEVSEHEQMNGSDERRQQSSDVDLDDDEDEDDQRDADFDPTEVLKRMKVELKEEFDDEEEAVDNELITGQKQMMALMANQRMQHHHQRKNHEHNSKSNKNSFMPNLFGGAATATANAAHAGFDQSATIEYFRKIFAGTLANHFSGASADLMEEPAQLHRQSPQNQSQQSKSSSQSQSQLAAFTAAAAAFAATQGPNGSSTSTSADSSILDESKKRLIQAILLKQLNGDLDGNLDIQNLFNQSLPASTSTSGSFKSQLMQPQQSMQTDDPQQRYCTSCNIQFISAKTFKVHKELYCSGRHQNSTATSATNNSSLSAASTSAMTCGTSHDSHSHHGLGHRKGSGHQHHHHHGGMASAPMHHNLSPPPMSLTSAGSSNGSPSLSHTSAASSRKRSSSSWTAEAQKEVDYSSFLPNMMFPNGLAGLNSENLSFPLNPSIAPSSSEPIYIAISTNPLILLPFVFNSATNSLVPMANGANNGAILPNALGTNFGAGKPSAPIIFPNGMPSMSGGAEQSANHCNSLSSPSPSNHSSSNSSSASTNRQTSSNSNLPFITTFSNLSQHLMNTGTGQTTASVSPQVSPRSQNQTTSALINSLINSELNETKSGKKRRHSNEEQSEEPDQPLDLSSGSIPAIPFKSKRAKEDPFAAFANAFNPLDLNVLSGNNKMASKKEQLQEGTSDSMNSFLQKFAQMQSDPLTSSLLFPGLATPSAAAVGFADQLASINAMARENPAFAQYLAVAMAALSGVGPNGTTGSSAPPAPVPSTVPSVSPQVDVVVKQGNSRCVECNIVFYKHENYLVHKELYCASRRTSGSQDGAALPNQSSPVPPGVPTNATLSIVRPTSAHSSASSAASPSLLSPGKYGNALRSPKTNADELTLSTSPSLMVNRDSASVSPGASMSSPKPSGSAAAAIFQYYCAACGIKFTSYDNLQAHQTYYCLKRSSAAATGSNQTPIQSTSPVSVTNAVPSPAASMLTTQQILAAAASLQGAEGLDFSSPSALSQQLALITAAATAAVQSANQAAASGKSPLSQPGLGDYHCAKCKATYVTADTLAAHVCSAELRQAEKTESKPSSAPSTSSLQTYKCTICGYKGHTMRGMRTHVRVHSEQLAATGAYEEEFIVQNTDLPEPSLGRGRGAHLHSSLARQRRRSNTVDNEANSHQAQLEQQRKMKLDHEQMMQQAKSNSMGHLSPDGSLVAQSHTCQFCRYTSNYKGNVIRHIKLVHKDIASAQLAATIALQQQALAKELQGSMSGLGDGTSSSVGDFASTTSGGDLDSTDVVSIKCEESSKSPIRLTNGASVKDEDEEISVADRDLDTRHCSSCNISFTYRNSYLAHKKYYCSSHTSEP